MEFRIRPGQHGFQYLRMPDASPLGPADGDFLPEPYSQGEFVRLLAKRLNGVASARIVLVAALTVAAFFLGSTFANPALSRSLLAALLAVLAVGVAVCYGLARKLDHYRRDTVLIYELPAGAGAPYETARKACRVAARAARVTRSVEGDGEGPARLSVPRQPVAIDQVTLPDFRANVDVWGIDAGREKILFLPDGVLTIVDRALRMCSYDRVGARGEIIPVVEQGIPPPDAQVIGYRWRHAGGDGGPDPRFHPNPRFPVVAYARVTVRVGDAHSIDLQFSNARVGLQFRDLLNQASQRPRRHHPGPGRAGIGDAAPPLATAPYVVLGIRPGAPLAEVTAAYRALAQKYHPDLHATEPPEFRALAEHRMKQINAAYEEIKRRSR